MKKQLQRTSKSESTTSPSTMEKDLKEVDEIESDDEAPETVSFNQGRKEAFETISNALQDLQRVKLKTKERRRERDKLLKEQKQKRVSLSNARLPPELLDKLTQQQDSTTQQSENPQEQPQTESSPGDETTEHLRKDAEDSDFEDFDDFDDEDIDSSPIQVIQRSKMRPLPPNKSATQFLQKQLYGSRIPRESMAKYISRKRKRFGQPGMNFHFTKSPGVKKKKKGKRSLINVSINE